MDDLSRNPDAIDQAPRRTCTKLRLMALIALVSFGAVIVFSLTTCLPSHPRFGAIREAAAFDLNAARSNPLAGFVRSILPDDIVQSPSFPSCFKDQPRYLQLGDMQMEWSIGDGRKKTGWLYFWNLPDTSAKSRGWQFAPCTQTNLNDVTNLPLQFYGASDSRPANIFGTGKSAIGVAEGQVWFARRTENTNQVYILKLKQQDRNKLLVDYCVLTP